MEDNTTSLRLLMVEDTLEDAELILHQLRGAGYNLACERVETASGLESVLCRSEWDLVISDYVLPGFSGLEALAIVKKSAPHLPFILVSGVVDEDLGVETMRLGAQDYISKRNTGRLLPAIRRELCEGVARRKAAELQRKLDAETSVVERLRELDQLKDRFVEMVTHEMRTPMTPLRSAIDLLLEGELGPLTDTQREHLEMMSRNIERLARLASDVLVLARIDNVQGLSNTKVIDLHENIRFSMGLLRAGAAAKDVNLVLTVPAGLLVRADSDALNQVVTNLVNNAIVHNPEGTQVTVSAAMRASGLVAVTVADNGMGIPEQACAGLFSRFYQVNRQAGPGYRGTGLGLAICKELLGKMNGDISVKSTEGQGTTFTFTLPAGLALDAKCGAGA